MVIMLISISGSLVLINFNALYLDFIFIERNNAKKSSFSSFKFTKGLSYLRIDEESVCLRNEMKYLKVSRMVLRVSSSVILRMKFSKVYSTKDTNRAFGYSIKEVKSCFK